MKTKKISKWQRKASCHNNCTSTTQLWVLWRKNEKLMLIWWRIYIFWNGSSKRKKMWSALKSYILFHWHKDNFFSRNWNTKKREEKWEMFMLHYYFFWSSRVGITNACNNDEMIGWKKRLNALVRLKWFFFFVFAPFLLQSSGGILRKRKDDQGAPPFVLFQEPEIQPEDSHTSFCSQVVHMCLVHCKGDDGHGPNVCLMVSEKCGHKFFLVHILLSSYLKRRHKYIFCVIRTCT